MARTVRTPILILLCAGWLASPAAAASSKPPETPQAATLRRGEAYYHLVLARMDAMRGRFSDTVRQLKQAAELMPDSAELLAESAHLLAQINRRDEAERLARRAVELDPSSTASIRVLGDLLASRALGRPSDPAARDEAIRLYEQLAKAPDADVQVLQLLTNLHLLAEDLPAARAVAEQYVERKPGDAAGAKLLAQILIQQGRPGEALRAVLDFLSANPGAPELSRLASDIAARAGGWEEIEAAARRMSEAAPGELAPKALLGEALLRQGKSAEALQELSAARESAAQDPSWDGEIGALLGEAYLREGRQEAAVPLLEKAIEAGASDPMVRLHLATAYGTVGRLADASALARSLADSYPDNPSILVILGECMAQQGNLASAVEAFASAILGIDGSEPSDVERRDELRLRIASLYLRHRKVGEADAALRGLERPDRPGAIEIRARVALLGGHTREARQLASKLGAGDRDVATLLEGESLAREGRSAKAEAVFDGVLATQGDKGRERVAAIWREAGQPQRAERLLREWVKSSPDDPEARFALGQQLERQGSFGEAEGELRRTIEIDPNNAEALNYLGYSLADRNQKLEDALAYVQRALQIDEWNGAFHDSLGWVYYRMGAFEKAREPLERAAREYPHDPTVLDHLGDLYDKLGDAEGAERAWRRALEAEPEDPEAIRTKLARPRGKETGSSRDRTSGGPGGSSNRVSAPGGS